MTVTFDDLSMFSMSVNALLKSILNSRSGDELLGSSCVKVLWHFACLSSSFSKSSSSDSEVDEKFSFQLR